MTTSPGEIVIGTLTYENLQYLSKAFSSDYLNVTYPPAAKTIAGTIVDFLYTRARTLNVNAYSYPRPTQKYTSVTSMASGTPPSVPMAFRFQQIVSMLLSTQTSHTHKQTQ